jgi:hypothetical protein
MYFSVPILTYFSLVYLQKHLKVCCDRSQAVGTASHPEDDMVIFYGMNAIQDFQVIEPHPKYFPFFRLVQFMQVYTFLTIVQS